MNYKLPVVPNCCFVFFFSLFSPNILEVLLVPLHSFEEYYRLVQMKIKMQCLEIKFLFFLTAHHGGNWSPPPLLGEQQIHTVQAFHLTLQ